MSYVYLSEGGSRWCPPLACGPCPPELSNSDSETARKSFTFTYLSVFSCLHRTNSAFTLYCCQGWRFRYHAD